tara:strand:- start:1724 stop:2185 length:462 start_codon:yes stop_codon:yes gene_type:complete
MKNLKLALLALLFFIAGQSQAQVAVNVNIGTPPAWGPAGYSNVDYYYLPDVEAYYDIRAAQFIYFSNGKWNRNKYLAGPYRNYDLYNGYKVVLHDYHGKSPYTYFKTHKVKYYKGYKGKPQKNIGTRKTIYVEKVNKKSHKENNGKSKHSKNK